MEKVKAFIEAHPWATAGIVFIVGVILIYWWSSGSSSSSSSGSSSDLTGAYNAAAQAAVGNDALQAAQMQNQNQLALGELAYQNNLAQTAAAQTISLAQANAPVIEAQISGDVQTQSLADQLAGIQSTNTTNLGIARSTNKANVAINASNNAASIATNAQNNTTAQVQARQAGKTSRFTAATNLTGLENTNAELVSVAGINAQAGETINAQNNATAFAISNNDLAGLLNTNTTNYEIATNTNATNLGIASTNAVASENVAAAQAGASEYATEITGQTTQYAAWAQAQASETASNDALAAVLGHA